LPLAYAASWLATTARSGRATSELRAMRARTELRALSRSANMLFTPLWRTTRARAASALHQLVIARAADQAADQGRATR
jgi:hypothetical protein